ncbi:MAG TPA: ABC transporter ATP-binding protein [Acidimicrobiales bacterium]|nr:ABC transporter ATP-binding protein [Acidimicrobiales bacterium]
MIALDHLTKRYGPGPAAVADLSLEVVTGEVCILIGPSGCGKSTTLRMINRLIEPTSGHIWIDGEDVTTVDPVELRRRIGYVIQNIGLFPHLTVGDNVAVVPRLLGWSKRRVKDRVSELLALVGLDPVEFSGRWPRELSGGQQQRVGVARALGADPPVLLMDEPFGAIDPITRHRLQEEFLELQQRVRKTVVLVTHDLEEAVRLGDRIALLRQGGHLEQYATPGELLGAPATPFVAEFVGTDRSLRRLAVTPLKSSDVATRRGAVSAATELPAVHVGESLRDVLVAILESPTGRARVLDDAGEPCGTIDAAGVHAAARRSLPQEVARELPHELPHE